MATWQVRLSRSKVGKNQKQTYMREHFADNHSLIIISYAIRTDITNLSPADIKSHLKSVHSSTPQIQHKVKSIPSYMPNIMCFRDGMKVRHTVISPFYKIAPNKVRVGIVDSACAPLGSFFGASFSNIINAHVNAHGTDYFIYNLQNIVGEHYYLPARRVKWQSGYVDRLSLGAQICDEMANKKRYTVIQLI